MPRGRRGTPRGVAGAADPGCPGGGEGCPRPWLGLRVRGGPGAAVAGAWGAGPGGAGRPGRPGPLGPGGWPGPPGPPCPDALKDRAAAAIAWPGACGLGWP